MEWTILLTILANTFAIIGTTIFFYFHSDSKFESFKEEMNQYRSDMAREQKEFHGRLVALEEKYYQWLMRDKK